MKKAADLVFRLSFIPAVGILFGALVSMVIGSAWITEDHSAARGFLGFFYTLFYGVGSLTVIPVLPACVSYQVAYRVYEALVLRTRRQKAVFFTVSTLLGVAVTVLTPLLIRRGLLTYGIFFAVIAAVCLVFAAASRSTGAEARKAYYAADERISFGGEVSPTGIMGIPVQRSCILIDRRNMTVSFLVSAEQDLFCQFELYKSREDESGCTVQAEFPLKDGGRLICLCPDEDHRELTSGVMLIDTHGMEYRSSVMNGEPPALGLCAADNTDNNEYDIQEEYYGR